MSRPTIAPPDVSFGPRWSASVARQDRQCVDCHRENVAAHWEESTHMSKHLTCVTCHDIHTTQDKPLQASTQADVCTTCHKKQKTGMHALTTHIAKNPVCTTCHNPHGDQSPVTGMLSNRSAGCRTCHDLVAMRDDPTVSARAKNYHGVMVQMDRICMDCHLRVAHGPPGEVKPFIPPTVASREVTLFYPGQSDIDWILGEHPGSQPFRQGTNCQQCHRGDEVGMGALLGTEAPTSRSIFVDFDASDNSVVINLSWKGEASDQDVAVMWSDDKNQEFRRGGCWASCHSDMPGMNRDRGLGLSKYLSSARAQQQMIGQPPLMRSVQELQQMIGSGEFVEMWRVNLQKGGEINVATLLSGLDWQGSAGMSSSARYSGGSWKVRIERPYRSTPPFKAIDPNQEYTFGIAMHPQDRPGAKHWVSLPMTFSLTGNDSDFRAD
jgi:predicted CXXCH cytochrome family protein